MDPRAEIEHSASLIANQAPSFEAARASSSSPLSLAQCTGIDSNEMPPSSSRTRDIASAAQWRREVAYHGSPRPRGGPVRWSARLGGDARPLLAAEEDDGAASPRSMATSNVNDGFGEPSTRVWAREETVVQAEEVAMDRRDTFAESLLGDSGSAVSRKRKRASSVWQMGKKIAGKARKMSLAFRRLSTPPGPVTLVAGGGDGAEEASPLLPSPTRPSSQPEVEGEIERYEYAISERPASRCWSAYDGIVNAYPADQPPTYRSHDNPSAMPRHMRSGSVRTLASEQFWPTPHPDYEDTGSYFNALDQRVWERAGAAGMSEQGAQDLEAHFGRMDFNAFREREIKSGSKPGDGLSSVFWPGSDYTSIRGSEAGSDQGSVADQRGSLQAHLAEIRAYGPCWARGWHAASQGLDVVDERERTD